MGDRRRRDGGRHGFAFLEMSAFFITLDVLLGALILRVAWPNLDAGTQFLTVVFGGVILFWKWTRQ
jgi:hypothetical protein